MNYIAKTTCHGKKTFDYLRVETSRHEDLDLFWWEEESTGNIFKLIISSASL